MRKSSWKPDTDEALKVLIRQTIDAAGPMEAGTLPHRLKERLKSQIDGTVDLDAMIKEVLKEQNIS